jgi:predicted transcriptional regulator
MVVKRETREQARQLRTEGIPVIEIAKQLGVSKDAVSDWTNDIELTPEQIENLQQYEHRTIAQLRGAKANKDKALAKRKEWQELGRKKAREGHLLHRMGCVLYWGEGAKQRNNIHFVNTDPEMLRLFIRFLRDELHVADEKITLYLQCYSLNISEQEKIQMYWLDILGLKTSCLGTVNVKKTNVRGQNKYPHGICTITVSSTEVAMHIYGAIQEYMGFDRPEWLF